MGRQVTEYGAIRSGFASVVPGVIGSPSTKNVTPPPALLGINPSESDAVAVTRMFVFRETVAPDVGAVRVTTGGTFEGTGLATVIIVGAESVTTPSVVVALATTLREPTWKPGAETTIAAL